MWLVKLLKKKAFDSNFPRNNQGLDDGGNRLDGTDHTLELMSFEEPNKKKKYNVHKKIKRNPRERPGEPPDNQMHPVQRTYTMQSSR